MLQAAALAQIYAQMLTPMRTSTPMRIAMSGEVSALARPPTSMLTPKRTWKAEPESAPTRESMLAVNRRATSMLGLVLERVTL